MLEFEELKKLVVDGREGAWRIRSYERIPLDMKDGIGKEHTVMVDRSGKVHDAPPRPLMGGVRHRRAWAASPSGALPAPGPSVVDLGSLAPIVSDLKLDGMELHRSNMVAVAVDPSAGAVGW